MCEPVNGSWSAWGPWTGCDVTCGAGSQTRTRLCDNPAPSNGGLFCSGAAQDFQSCTRALCPVDGNWSPWSFWSSCDVTCASGVQFRNRSCDNPPPIGGGANCSGVSDDFQVCNTSQLCPVHGNWSQWSPWSACNVTCGLGSQSRNRSCDSPPPQHGGANCGGSPAEVQSCDSGQPCAVHGNWSQWSPWSACNATCGLGSQSRYRSCDSPPPQHGGANCSGSSEELQGCDSGQPCAGKFFFFNGNWSAWSLWSACNASCGVGYQTRNRTCDNPEPLNGGANCTGTAQDVQECDFLPPCAVDGGWSPWTPWSNCSETCGNGVRNRTRSCDNPPPQHGGANCTGDANQSETCGIDLSCYACPPAQSPTVWARD
ncbi:coadhesin-like [Branchiostoma floridae]|uniref:Coadhesin-like n=1 Tax=Branchiostoma floridae TaxID=7739 RepID=A0A9J7KHP0_BRAFL|nr:coadhesin-like [Branchiostoma floridae]